MLRVATSVSTRCCVPVNANMQTMVPVRLPMSYCRCNCGLTSRGGRVEREVYVSGRGLFHSLVRVDSSTAAALYGWTRRGLFHSLIRRVDYRLKTTVGHAVVAARSRTGADCCNLYRSLATRTPGRGTGERTEESTRGLSRPQQPCTGGLFHSPRPSVRDPISQCCERIVPAGFR